MTVQELRRKYLDFFISKGHSEHPSGSLIPFDVTGRLDESLLFNGAGMVQFKPYFRGVAEPASKRLTTSQKCLRTGDIDEVGDDSHLTFFEMLGNFSFGDYFKGQAIEFSWEFLTSPEWLGLDPKRLAFTVFSEDDEAFTKWSELLSAAGIDPESRIFRLGEDTNYWPAGAFSKGPPGPCGPNSEMFYWTGAEAPPSGPYSKDDYLRDEAAGKWLEIWNDVFIQYEWQGELKDPARPDQGYAKKAMPDLPFKSIDTGMGIERTVAVLNGFRSVYDTDAFQPIFRAMEGLGAPAYGSDEESMRAMRIIGDHLRAACFCIADGILPSNTGRGYVLRRLLRRAVLKGVRVLKFEDAFLHQLVEAVVANFGGHYHELVDRRPVIEETLRNEEAQFRRTLEAGSERLEDLLAAWRGGSKAKSTPLAGDMAFMLYDTFGFPLEVTQELCAEAGVSVDVEGYRAAMAEAQERSRASSGMDTVYGGVGILAVFTQGEEKATPTKFLGYTATESEATITGTHPMVEGGESSNEFVLALDQTPFYAESGGQVSDTGRILGDGFELKVLDVTKQDGVFIHLVEVVSGVNPVGLGDEAAKAKLQEAFFNHKVQAIVDRARRKEIARHHTATHLMHAALRQHLGTHVTQAGSMVAPDVLRFDFTHGAGMSREEIAAVEQTVTEQILAAQGMVTYEDVPLDDARKMGAMALFGEKYADRVRVVQVGTMDPGQPSFSRELCGGIHVGNTGEIGLFKILHESSAASGVRRITAVTGTKAVDWLNQQLETLHVASAKLKTNPHELIASIEKTLDTLREERKKREKLAQQGAGASAAEEHNLGPVTLFVQKLEDADPADAKAISDRLVDGKPNAVALIVNVAGGKVTFVAKVGPDALKAGAKAGDLVKTVAQVTGGGGGGAPNFATAGGRDASKVDEAIAAGIAALQTAVS